MKSKYLVFSASFENLSLKKNFLIAISILMSSLVSHSQLKTYLHGAFSAPLGRHKDVTVGWAGILNANALTQPYNIAPFNYAGAEAVAMGFFVSTPLMTDIVDWVLLELRDPLIPAMVIKRRAAFIREDGQIVDLGGFAPVFFNLFLPITPDGPYHLVIRHRNHLAIRTPIPLALVGGFLAAYDFSIAQAQAFQNPAIPANAAQKGLTPILFGMWGGNVNSDGTIRASGLASQNDYLSLISALGNNPTAIIPNVYNRADLNMDGTIRASGLAPINDYLFLLNALDNDPSKIVLQHQ